MFSQPLRHLEKQEALAKIFAYLTQCAFKLSQSDISSSYGIFAGAS